MDIKIEEVQGYNKISIPDEDETIGDFLNLEELAPVIKEVMIYERPKEACPFARGNWVIDTRLKNGQLTSIKLPLKMKEEQVMRYVKPLIDIIDESRKSKMN